jgi:hypothetical protein
VLLLTACGLIAAFVLGSCFTSILMRDNILLPDILDKTPVEVYVLRITLMVICVILFIAWCVVTVL